MELKGLSGTSFVVFLVPPDQKHNHSPKTKTSNKIIGDMYRWQASMTSSHSRSGRTPGR